MGRDIIPQITNLGLFDFKLKYGSAQHSERRCVNSFEIELPTAEGGLSYIDDRVYPIEADRVICAKPGQWRRTRAPFICQYIHIIPDDSEVCDILKNIPDTVKLENDSVVRSLLDEIIIEYTRSAHNFNLILYAKFLTLINELHLCSTTNDITVVKGRKVDIKAVEDAVNFINANYMNKITLDSLSRLTHISPIYFRQLFFDTTGMTPYDYVLDKRIEKAKQLLAVTNIPIADIATSCGFTDHAYMGKVFKQITGYTPLRYRKMQNEIYP